MSQLTNYTLYDLSRETAQPYSNSIAGDTYKQLNTQNMLLIHLLAFAVATQIIGVATAVGVSFGIGIPSLSIGSAASIAIIALMSIINYKINYRKMTQAEVDDLIGQEGIKEIQRFITSLKPFSDRIKVLAGELEKIKESGKEEFPEGIALKAKLQTAEDLQRDAEVKLAVYEQRMIFLNLAK